VPEESAPGPEVVRAARQHLTDRFARGVERLLWEESKHPLPDLLAAHTVLETAARDTTVTRADLAAALVVLQAARLDVDHLEYDVIEAARALGMDYEQVAAALDQPNAEAARVHAERLRARRELRTDRVSEPTLKGPGATNERARRARHRADQAAKRAQEAATRGKELAAHRTPAPQPELARRRAEAAQDQLVAARRQTLLSLVGLAEACERAAEAFERLAAAADPALAPEHLAKASEHRALAVEYRVRARREADR
jgi:hypothetical protein